MKEDNGLEIGGVFTFELVRDGKVIDRWEEKNLVVNEGLNHLLDVVLHNSSQQATWYIGLFNDNYTPLATDTAAAPGWTESTNYDEATREEYVEAAASGQSITNSANKAEFTMNAAETIYGAFLISNSTKGGTASVLFAASKFSVSRSVVASDVLLVTYTVNAASS